MAATHADVSTILFLPLVLNMFYNISKCNLQLAPSSLCIRSTCTSHALQSCTTTVWASNAGDNGGIDSDL